MPVTAGDGRKEWASGRVLRGLWLWFFGVVLGAWLLSALLAVALDGFAVGFSAGDVLGDDGRGVHGPAVITVLVFKIAVRVSVGSGN